MQKIGLFLCLSLFLDCLLTTSALAKSASVFDYFDHTMDQYYQTFYVYADADAAGNHFLARARVSGDGEEQTIPPMNEHYRQHCYQGDTCIQAAFNATGHNWGGWYFMNGVMSAGATEPTPNWGDVANAGVDLSNAKQLSFWARGETGGEVLEFIALGLGRDANNGQALKPYPDSAQQLKLKVSLTQQWQQYTLDTSASHLNYVIGGFGWVTNAQDTKGNKSVFYLDEIQYAASRLEEPRLLTSFEVLAAENDVDKLLRNAAFTYDNALTLIAYIAQGDMKRAKLIADALLTAQSKDRAFKDGRLRNAYRAGEMEVFSGLHPQENNISSPLPGFSCPKPDKPVEYTWCEDEFQVSTHTGNVAWAMLGLLAYYEVAGGQQYLAAAEQLGEWVVTNCSATAPGYTGGYQGWEASVKNPQGQRKLNYKATEHNIDLYAAFKRLYKQTNQPKWQQRADSAKAFVAAMWDAKQGRFWTGTGDDGLTINQTVIPLDVQAWSVLAFAEAGKAYWPALMYAEKHHAIAGGFDFNEDKDGIWYEGTAQMAEAYAASGQADKWNATLKVLDAAQRPSGAIPAASKDGLTTGFYLSNGKPWLYFAREHLGASAWYALAKLKVNPFAGMVKSK
jgi:hypothetical protein